MSYEYGITLRKPEIRLQRNLFSGTDIQNHCCWRAHQRRRLL